jgi:hypothetical protein
LEGYFTNWRTAVTKAATCRRRGLPAVLNPDHTKIYQFGWDGNAFHHLDVGGEVAVPQERELSRRLAVSASGGDGEAFSMWNARASGNSLAKIRLSTDGPRTIEGAAL